MSNVTVGNEKKINMKIMTILGTRPEIIRLSRIIPKLDKCCEHILLHTGQNYNRNLNDIFFEDLGLRQPDVFINSKSNTLGEQLAKIFVGVEKALLEHKPDKVLILGDTNTSLCTVIVERLGFPVYHMEAGNRCFDLKVPEEKNRRVIDCISSFNLPYTPGSRENLLRDGYPKNRIFETGNPINEVMKYYEPQVSKSDIIKNLGLQGDLNIVLVTAHRAENVDDEKRLNEIFKALNIISKTNTVVFSCHPRTKNKIAEFVTEINGKIIITEPMGFFDFLKLESWAKCVISDSGTVQEECCLLHTPTVTIRDTTERPETVECGSNIVSGLRSENIISNFIAACKSSKQWKMPVGYDEDNVSDRVVNFLIGNQIVG
jgi:UDP-N-acetylglucosamine 2-epimerase (non-hydrolysing)